MSRRVVVALFGLVLTFSFISCGGNSGGQSRPSTPTPAATLATIEITPIVTSMQVATTQQLSANGVLSDGTHQVLALVTWTSSNPSVAGVDTSGRVTSKAAGTSVITATSGSFSASAAVTVIGAVPRFAYVFNDTAIATISAYTVDPSTGQLRSNGYTELSNLDRASIAADPSGKYVYVSGIRDLDTNTFQIRSYTVGANGRLSPTGHSVALGQFPAFMPGEMVLDPLGRFLYQLNRNTGAVHVVRIDLGDGSLNSVSGSPFPVADIHSELVADPAGEFLYVIGGSLKLISAFSVDPISGALSHVNGSPFADAGQWDGGTVAMDPTGSLLYVSKRNGGGLYQSTTTAYAVNRSTGALKPTGAVVSSGVAPLVSAVDPTGTFLLIGDAGYVNQSSIRIFRIDRASGGLQEVVGSPFTGNSAPGGVAFDPSGKFVYVTNRQFNDVWVYTLSPQTGALTRQSTVIAQGQAAQMAFVGGTQPATYAPLYLYTANRGGHSVSAFAVNSGTGALTPATGVASGLSDPRAVAVDPLAKFLYVADGNANRVAAFSVGNNGMLGAVPGSPFAGRGCPLSLVVDPSAQYLTAANQDLPNLYTGYTVAGGGGLAYRVGDGAMPDANMTVQCNTTGEGATFITQGPSGRHRFLLSSAGIYSFVGSEYALGGAFGNGNTPSSAVVHPEGKVLYVTYEGSNTVWGYLIHTYGAAEVDDTGMIEPLAASPVATGKAPVSITGVPSGRFFYVANRDSNNISGYTFNATTGGLDPMPSSFPAGSAPVSLATDLSGSFLYVANRDSDTVGIYAIDQVTGALQPRGQVPTGHQPVSVTTSGVVR